MYRYQYRERLLQDEMVQDALCILDFTEEDPEKVNIQEIDEAIGTVEEYSYHPEDVREELRKSLKSVFEYAKDNLENAAITSASLKILHHFAWYDDEDLADTLETLLERPAA